jgi:hypothetical protein
MAIRLREVKSTWVALCAVESDPKEGDIYLDDAMHHALAGKFARDWELDWQHDHLHELMDSQKMRDAQEVHKQWEKERK